MQRPRSRTSSFLILLAIIVCCGLAPNAVQAQGFSVYEQGTCTMAQAGAAVAHPCGDASAIFFNPAGLLQTDGLTISGGATTILARGRFTSDYTRSETELQNDPVFAPHVYGAWRATSRLVVGLGAYVPYGLETKWPANWEGAFEGYDNGLRSIYVQPTVAYQVTDRIRVGAGPILGIGSVTLNQRLDASQQRIRGRNTPDDPSDDVYFGAVGIPFHTAFADVSLDASGAVGWGAHVGLSVQVAEWLDVGARFMSPITFNYEGEATFEKVSTGLQLPPNNPITGQPNPLDLLLAPSFVDGPLVDQSVETKLTMPAQVVAGVSVRATERLRIQADYQWTGWSSFDAIPLDFENDVLDRTREENYNNTSAIRVGGAYEATDALTVRAGYLFNQAAAPDRAVTPLLPEASRNHLTAGFNWQIIEAVGLNVAYQYLGQNDRRGRVRDTLPGEQTPTVAELNSGLYAFHAHLIGTTFTIRL